MRACFALLTAVLFLTGLTACGGGGSSATAPAAAADSSATATSAATPSGGATASSGASAAPAGGAAPTAVTEGPIRPPRTTVTPDPDPDPDPNEFVQLEYEAVPQNEARIRQAIQYPAALKGKKITGTVYVKVLIDKDGYYKSHLVRDSPDPALAQAVVDQVKNLYCSPARLNGKPIKVWVNFEYTFQ